MAGIVFKSETHVLMGYQPHKAMISGIGGKPHEHELLIETAFRETIEELFGIDPPISLIHTLINTFNAGKVSNDGYTMFILPFSDIPLFLSIVSAFGSPYYSNFPTTITDLILNRRAPHDAEVTHLALVPIILDAFQVDQRDMRII